MTSGSRNYSPISNTAGSFCSFGYVRANGTIETQGGDWTVVRLSTGIYRVTYANPMVTIMAPILANEESAATLDSDTIRFDNVTLNGFDVNISEGDNGTAANTPRDRDWSFAVPCGDPVGVSIAGPAGADGQTGADGLDAPISNAIPIADNENDTGLRAGNAGTSGDVSRADHNHPIRRQALFPHPDLTYTLTANSTAPQTSNQDRWSDEESVTFLYRVRIDAAAETGWNFITVPTVAGFQQPIISIDGTYRNTGNPQDSMPRAPFMGNEANHWSSTNRVYVGPFNQKTGTGRYYVALRVQYVRS